MTARRYAPEALLVALGLGLRLWQADRLAPPSKPRPLLEMPLDSPPLLDLVTLALAPEHRQIVSLLGGLAALCLVAALASRGLPRGAARLALGLAAVAPPLVFAGSWWAPVNLTVPLAALCALLLIRALDGPASLPLLVSLGLSGFLLAAADWAGMAPLLAWTAWLLLFRPWWMPQDRARRATVALAAASLATLLGWLGMMMLGSDPSLAVGVGSPQGLQALLMHLDSLASLMLGRVFMFPAPLRVALAVLTLALAWRGWRRTSPVDGSGSAWGSVLAVGSIGAFGVALLLHPWIRVAVEKSLWFITPALLCLVVAAIWPALPRPPRLLPLLAALALTGCVDADGDGAWASDDCDDEDPAVAPGLPDVFGDGLDNDCDGAVDSSASYLSLSEAEPNDTNLGACFAPQGQPLGTLAPFAQLNRLEGRIESVVDTSYVEGDRDCFVVRLPEETSRARLQVSLSWSDPASDLDFAVQGLWEGQQSGFALADGSGPGPEVEVTSSGFEPGESLWIWVIGYAGPPTDYRMDLLLWESSEESE